MARRPQVDQQLRFLYDHKADVLSICAGQSVYTDSIPLDENVILHVDPATQTIVGLSIVDFIQRFANTESPRAIPVNVTLERVKKKVTQRKRNSKK